MSAPDRTATTHDRRPIEVMFGDRCLLVLDRTDGGAGWVFTADEARRLAAILTRLADASEPPTQPERCPECGVHRNANPPDNPGIPHSPTCRYAPETRTPDGGAR